LNLYLLKQTSNLDNMFDCVASMSRGIDLVFIIDAILLPIVFIFVKKPYKKLERSLFLFLLIFIVSGAALSIKYYQMDVVAGQNNDNLFRLYWSPKITITNLSPVGFHIYDSYTFLRDSVSLKLSEQDKKEIKDWFSKKREDIPDNEYKAMFKGKNLIFIQVESLENFVIDRKIEGQDITPNLNALLKNSLYFPNINEQVLNGTSSDADLMSNTSVYPVRMGSTFFRFPANTYNSLPKMLERKGYSTIAMHPDKAAFWNWMNSLKSIGFQKCLDVSSFNYEETIGLGISDACFLRQVADRIVQQKAPFYSYCVTLSSHGPFNLPDKYRELELNPAMDKTKLGGYFQSVRYTDKQIGMMLSKLKDHGILDNSVVVIYGDHCGVHKYYQDELYDIRPSEDWWLNKNKCVPLIIYSQNMKGQKFDLIGGQVDILPTVSYLMGIDESEYITTAVGRNLLKTKKSFAVLSDETYVGTGTENEKQIAKDGIDISDKIIRGNYFKEIGYK
ncbi:MAG TPA: LTA synthase family protein, partial [Clostridia bacterium]